MKMTCEVVFEQDESGSYLTFVGEEKVRTLEFGDLELLPVEDFEEAFKSCGKETE